MTVEHYIIETGHLEQLKAIAKRLHTEDRMNGDEMRDVGHSIAAIVRFAETIGPLPEGKP